MPIYEYECECGEISEVRLDGFNPRDTIRCARCGKRAKRIVSKTDFLLKGSGWPGKELSQGEVVTNEKKRESEFNRKRRELRREGAEFPYHGDE